MNCILKRELVWPMYLPRMTDHSAKVLLIDGNGYQVGVPASILLALSPMVRNILTDQLSLAYSPCCISIPAATGDSLQLVGDILTTGTAADHHSENIEIIKQVLGMLGVEASLEVCSFDNKNVGCHQQGKMEIVDSTVVSEGDEVDVKLEIIVSMEEKDSSGLGDLDVKPCNLDYTEGLKSCQGVKKSVSMPHIAAKYKKRKIPCKLYKKMVSCNPCPLNCSLKSDMERRVDLAHKKVEMSVVASKMYEKKDVDGKRLCWQCTECEYESKKRDHVLKHVEQIHSGLSFQCDLCQAIFHRRDVLRDHVKKKHTFTS